MNIIQLNHINNPAFRLINYDKWQNIVAYIFI